MIGAGAFEDCKNIKKILLPKSLKLIDEHAFEKTKAAEVYFDGSLEDWDKIDIKSEDWSLMAYIDSKVVLDTSPLKGDNDFYILDDLGEKEFNGKRYKKIKY